MRDYAQRSFPALNQLPSPRGIFASGAQGFWLDVQDLSSMFQDAAGTVPAAVGQPVMLRRDKSGRGNHFVQATLANAPILQQEAWGAYYLQYDGVNDFYQSSAAIDLSAVDKVSAFLAIRKSSDAAIQIAAEFSASTGLNAGSFYFTAPETVLNTDFGFKSRGSTDTNGPARTAAGAFPAPVTAVLTGLGDIGGSRSILRLNGVERGNVTASQGTGNLGNYTMYLGSRGGTVLFFSGKEYGMVAVGKACTAAEIAVTEAYLNRSAKAY